MWVQIFFFFFFFFFFDGSVENSILPGFRHDSLLPTNLGDLHFPALFCKMQCKPMENLTKIQKSAKRVLPPWCHLCPLATRNQFDMYSFVSQSWCAFWQKNDMLLKWSIVKSTSEPKPQRKAYHLKDTSLLCNFKSSLYVILWYAFINWLTVKAGNHIILLSKSTS